MQYKSLSSDASLEVAEKVRTGEYFREARGMYDLYAHDPIAERYFYFFITGLSLLIFLIAFIAAQMLYPLQTPVPFIYSTNDIVEDVPHIHTLLGKSGENPSEALLRFMVENYVAMRENYDIDKIERSVGGVKSQSSEPVFREYQQEIDPRNPDSPITQYQRHSTRKIAILSAKRFEGGDFGMEIVFEATVESKGDIKNSLWQADIAFKYNGIALDEKADKVTPVDFVVTQYRVKRLQDNK